MEQRYFHVILCMKNVSWLQVTKTWELFVTVALLSKN